jgi:hypothetical protein
MSEESRKGSYVVARIDEGEYHVLFQPDELPHHYVSVARFQDKDRAGDYADLLFHVASDGLGTLTFGDDQGLKRIQPIGIRFEVVPAQKDAGPMIEAAAEPLKQIEQTLAAIKSKQEAPPAKPPEAAKVEPAPSLPPKQEPPVAPLQASPTRDLNAGIPAPLVPRPQLGETGATNVQRLHVAMLTMRDHENMVRTSFSEFAKRSGVPVGSVDAALHSLEQKGSIRKESEKGKPLEYRVLTGAEGKGLVVTPASAPSPTEPKPAWKKPAVEEIAIVNGSLPGRLAMAGRYMVAGPHTIMLSPGEVAIATLLINCWGSDVPGDELIRQMAADVKIKEGDARLALGPTIELLNKNINNTGLIIQKNAGGWRLRLFDEGRLAT